MKQLIAFDTLEIGNIHPTDIDAVIEYHDEFWIWIEYKYGDAFVPTGQRVMLERLCDDLGKTKPCIVLVATHDTEDPEEDIVAGQAKVRRIYYRGKWHSLKAEWTVTEVVESFIKRKGEI